MATIPIEVIVQDAEAPVVPSEDGTNNTETNITVPDTGAGTIGSNSTFSSASVASIIVPVVLLVLSLATVCTLLVHRHYKRQDSKASKKEKLAASASATIAVLAATVLVSNLVLPATKAATSDAEVAIEVPDKISIVVNREDDATEATTEATAYITSTSAFGYKVLLSMADGVDTANLYLDGDDTSTFYISPVEGEELATNTWGYIAEDEETYSAVSLADTPVTIAEDTEVVEDKELTVSYTVNIDKSLPDGTYTSELEYSIVAQEPTIDTLTYMQDFAKLSESSKASVLRSMTEGEQYTLKDSRDDKSYFISKLADGNVWMTQNLDLDIEAGRIYTSEDTDLAYSDIGDSWVPAISEATRITSDTTWDYSDTTPDSYDPGNLYWNGILNENWDGTLDNMTSLTGNLHYHIGNYYNWTAAVAMSNSSSFQDQTDTGQSICPAGWRLPTYSNDKSYDSLVSAQNLTSGADGNIQKSPAYFVYGGSWSGNSSLVGTYGTYLSSVVIHFHDASSLSFNIEGFLNSHGSPGRDNGYSLRCVAR